MIHPSLPRPVSSRTHFATKSVYSVLTTPEPALSLWGRHFKLCGLILILAVVLGRSRAFASPRPGHAEVTFYCPCSVCCGKWAGFNRTASGTIPKAGRTMAGPRQVPFGTKIFIEGIGTRVVEDRTRNGKGWDIFVPSHGEAVKRGIQSRKLVVRAS